MTVLETEDRKILVSLLKDLPEFTTERSRKQILDFAGLQRLIPMIDLSGSQFLAVSEIVTYLARHGRLNFEHEALGVFLNTLKEFVGSSEKQTIDYILQKYNLMVPVVPQPKVISKSSIDYSLIQEKIIGENTLKPIAFLSRALEIARSVVYIGVRQSSRRWSGTGFIVSPDIVLTNHHVIPDRETLSQTIIRLNYEESFDGQSQKVYEVRPNPEGLFETCAESDYTFFQLDSRVGYEWGWIKLAEYKVSLFDRVNIIQHPSGQPKQISFQNNLVEYVDENVIQYITSTLPGSSGSPVFNDGWEIVAIHHAGGKIQEPNTQRVFFRNEGILLKAILQQITEELRNELIQRSNTD